MRPGLDALGNFTEDSMSAEDFLGLETAWEILTEPGAHDHCGGSHVLTMHPGSWGQSFALPGHQNHSLSLCQWGPWTV